MDILKKNNKKVIDVEILMKTIESSKAFNPIARTYNSLC